MLFTYKKMFKWFWFNLTKTRRNVPQTDKIVIKFLLALLADWINWMKIKSLKVDIFASQTTFKMILIFTDKLISKISNAFLDALVPLGLGLLISFFSCKKNDSSRDRIFVFYEFCSLLVVVVLCFFFLSNFHVLWMGVICEILVVASLDLDGKLATHHPQTTHRQYISEYWISHFANISISIFFITCEYLSNTKKLTIGSAIPIIFRREQGIAQMCSLSYFYLPRYVDISKQDWKGQMWRSANKGGSPPARPRQRWK